jgi:hypothetical protein
MMAQMMIADTELRAGGKEDLWLSHNDVGEGFPIRRSPFRGVALAFPVGWSGVKWMFFFLFHVYFAMLVRLFSWRRSRDLEVASRLLLVGLELGRWKKKKKKKKRYRERERERERERCNGVHAVFFHLLLFFCTGSR